MERNIFLLSLLVITGCSQVDSNNLQTSEIYSKTIITRESSSTVKVSVELYNSERIYDHYYVNLIEGDVLYVTQNNDTPLTKKLAKIEHKGGQLEYVAHFTTTSPTDSYTISLERPIHENASARNIRIPTAVTLTYPITNELFSASQGTIDFMWTPVANQSEEKYINFNSYCSQGSNIENEKLYLSNKGIEPVSISEFIYHSVKNNDESCLVFLSMAREWHCSVFNSPGVPSCVEYNDFSLNEIRTIYKSDQVTIVINTNFI